MNERDTHPKPLPPEALDALLAAGAAQPAPALPDGLRARLLSQALEQMPAPAKPVRRRRPGAITRFWQAIGGTPGIAGLTAAGVAGIWIGVAPPAPVAGLPDAFWQGAALVSPELADWADDAPAGFGDDPFLALLTDD